jgi:steroid delta-isomerase-like uncharacterized protein
MATDTTLHPAVDLAWLRRFTDDWLAAWNSHEPDRLLGLMTGDVVYDDAAWPTLMRGHRQVREFLATAWRALPDMTFALVEGPYVHPEQPKAAFHWSGTATFTGPLDPPGFAPTGRSVTFEGVDFHEYRDGKVAGLRIDFDMMDVSRQLGLMPAQGSRSERALAAAQRLGARARRR